MSSDPLTGNRWPIITNTSPVWQDDSEPGRRLIDYLGPKIHSTVKQRDWKTIRVTGHYDRAGNNLVSPTEKRDRGFNWQRPTAEIIDEETVQLNCFPAANYTLHYASLLSTYLTLKSHDDVNPAKKVEQVPPEQDALTKLFSQSNLVDIGHADIIIVGYLDACPPELISRKNAFADARICEEGQLFSWHEQRTQHGNTAIYLGCAAALWGDSVKHLVGVLRRLCQMKCILYVGRVGCFDPAIKPNEALVIGESCLVDDTRLTHQNVLSQPALESPLVHSGSLITVPSPLCEDQEWFERWKGQYSWVDCETGYIAQAAMEGNIDFGYLHIVSDNLGCQYIDNLANEEANFVQTKRVALFEEINRILENFLSDYRHVSIEI